jgi:inorganic triphosphatase YgiF
MTDSLVETELKFLLTEDAARRLAALEGEEQDLVSTYFDTAGFDLLKRRATLRLRRQGEGWTQTLKAEGENAASRFEDERESRDGRLDPAAFSKRAVQIAGLKSIRGLAPVFETRIRRRARRVPQGGSIIELALDLGEIEAGGGSAPVRELELELKSGAVEDLLDLAREHLRAGGLSLSFTSKAERGYRLAMGDPLSAVPFQRPELDPKGAAAAGFQALALAALHQLCANAEILRLARKPEAVHQARVALRHLKTFVTAFKALVRDEGFSEVKAIVARLTAVFEDARSLDVFIADTFRPLAEHKPPGAQKDGAAAFGAALLGAQDQAYAKVQAAVSGDAFARDVFALADWTLAGGWLRQARMAETPLTLGETAERLLSHRRKAMVKRAARLDWSDAHARHTLRIQAKKMRYLTEAFAEPKAAKGFLKRLKALQDHLGVLNDIATAGAASQLALGQDTPSPDTTQAAFAAGLILGRRQGEERRRLKAAKSAMRAFAGEPAFWRG